MILLDENVPRDQHDLLRSWGIRCRLIGQDIANLSIGDDNIVALLHRLKNPTLLTRDKHFFARQLSHRTYCLAWLDVAPEESGLFARQFLAHPRFATHSRRQGVVAHVHHDGITFWKPAAPALQKVDWMAQNRKS